MKEQFGYKNEMQIPAIEKVVLNMGLGEGVSDKKKVQAAIAELELIAGQKPVPTVAKKSIATFKLRDGMVIGAKVTLRRDRMFEFIDRLVNIALPRQRLTMIRSIRFAGWISWCKQAPEQMKKPKHCWPRSRFLLKTRTNATS